MAEHVFKPVYNGKGGSSEESGRKNVPKERFYE